MTAEPIAPSVIVAAACHAPRVNERLRFMPLHERLSADATLYVISSVAAEWGLTKDDLIGPERTKHRSWARFCAYAAVRRERPHLSLPSIGRIFGKRDHTTVMHGIARFEELSASGELEEYRQRVMAS